MNQNCLGKYYSLYFMECCDLKKDTAWKWKFYSQSNLAYEMYVDGPRFWITPQTNKSEREGIECWPI